MGKQKSEREKKLQKKLIPVNIIVCIIALTAALTLFLTPILKVDVGATLRKQSVMELVEEKIVGTVDNSLEGSDQEDINYKPVVSMIVKEVFGKAEGEISVSALSAFRVLTGSGDKTQIAMDELLLGEDALATRLIDSVVDAVANVFTTDEGKDLLEDAVVRVMTKKIINEADDEEVSKTLNEVLTNQNVKELVGILKDLENVEDGDASEVAGKFIDKVNAMLGDKASIKDEDRQVVIDQVQEIYDGTKEHLADDESVSIEAVICVTLSENVDISTIKLENLIGKIKDLGGKKDQGSIHMNAVDEQLGDGSSEGENSGEIGDGPSEGEEPSESKNVIVTSYDDLLLEIGYDKDKKEEVKSDLRKALNEALTDVIQDKGVDDYMGYYKFLFLGMLAFIGPWVILFLFSFFHLLAKNKRFTMWYVKLICWIPPVIWLALKLLPMLANKFFSDVWNGEYGAVIKSIVSSISSFTWISGLCYILLWLVSIFWAFPIKRKIRKERKNPEVEDAYDDDYGDY